MLLLELDLSILKDKCINVGILSGKNLQIKETNIYYKISKLDNNYKILIDDILVNICNNNIKLLRYCLVNNTLDVHPKCPICGKDRSFNKSGFFHKTCGNKECNFKSGKLTNLYKYGVENPFANKDIQDKIKQTNLSKYGVDNPSKSDKIYNKVKQTNLEKYGVEYPLNSQIVRDKAKQTCLNHFGVEYSFQSLELQNNIRKIFKDKYGVEYILQSKEFMEKYKQTCLKRFGSELYVTSRYHDEYSLYFYNDIYFDSSYELVFYKFCIDHNIDIIREPIKLEYYINNIKHYYYPDFKIILNNKEYLVEISSGYTWYTKSDEKKELIINNNILVIMDKDIHKYFNYCKEINFNYKNYKRGK